jgi:hypothetical protein
MVKCLSIKQVPRFYKKWMTKTNITYKWMIRVEYIMKINKEGDDFRNRYV